MWEDVTSYSRGDTGRVPRSWKYNAGGLKIVVTRHVDYPGAWILQCDPWFPARLLVSTDVENAKTEAFALVRAKIEIALRSLPPTSQAGPAHTE